MRLTPEAAKRAELAQVSCRKLKKIHFRSKISRKKQINQNREETG